MEKTQIYEYFAFGYNYYLLRFLAEGTPIHMGEDSFLSRCEEFFHTLRILDLQETLKVASDLNDIFEKVKKFPKDAKVDETLSKRVQAAFASVSFQLNLDSL